MRETDVNVSAVQCWTSLEEFFGVVPCTIMSMMSDVNMPSACEVDVWDDQYVRVDARVATPSALLDWNNYGDDPTRRSASTAATCRSRSSKT
jgi:L-fucose isomerase-like protein